MQIAAPENQVTRARATPKKPNWASLLGHHLGHPDRGGGREHRRRDAGDHAGRHEHPRPHVAQQEEPRAEPPQPRTSPPVPRWRRARRRAHRRARRADRRGPPCTTAPAAGTPAHASRRPAPARGGRRHARRYTRCSAVVNEVAKKIVSTRPSRPVAFRMSSADAKALLASSSASPRMPSRDVRAVMIDERMRSGTKAATTITSGKNETKAFPASATLRSTNSISSMRSHTRQRSSRSNRARRRPCARTLRCSLCTVVVVSHVRLTVSTRPARRRSR